MKLVTFGDDGRIGALDGEEIAVLDVPTMREYFERGGADETGERVALAETRLRAPIVPKKFFHTAGNFREHEEESKQVDWSHKIAPWIVFFQNVDALVGQDEPVIYPEHLTEELDYELELAVVIGRDGRHIARADALSYVAGYAIANDISTRDVMFRPRFPMTDFAMTKLRPTFFPVGPYIVPAEFVPDPRALHITLKVNGEVMQDEGVDDIIYGVEQLVAYTSSVTELWPGDLLLTGSPAGNAGHHGNRWLRPGDVMEGAITGLGVQRTRCVADPRRGSVASAA